ncbi:MAG TPA: O-antigen ligase family protein [Roseiarcus sp.]|jgi:O-antigen ligase
MDIDEWLGKDLNDTGKMSHGMHPGISEANRRRSYQARPKRGSSCTAFGGPSPKGMIDKFTIVPIAACVFALIVAPLLFYYSISDPTSMEGRPEPRIFWPAIATISILLVARNYSRLRVPPHIAYLFAYLAFAGTSVLWAFSQDHSFVRYLQQLMIVTSIVLTTLLAAQTVDIMRAMFLIFAFALILNLYFVFGGSVTMARYTSGLVDIGYQGYFIGKNYLGECATLAFLLSLHEMLYRGWRRVFGAIFVAISVSLVFLSHSKTAFGLALISPLFAVSTLALRKVTRLSPALILLSVPFCFVLLSHVSNFNFERISYILYGDSSLTGRTVIWDFANSEIAQKPVFGWGYQSFWLVPNSPAYTEAPGWVKGMPNAHNGYYDTMLEMGYLGLAFLLAFIIATLHAIGRVADRDPRRALLLLSLAIFIILYNFFESLWARGYEFLWVTFVIVAAEIGRYWGPFPLRRPAPGSRSLRAGFPDPSLPARGPRLRIGLS